MLLYARLWMFYLWRGCFIIEGVDCLSSTFPACFLGVMLSFRRPVDLCLCNHIEQADAIAQLKNNNSNKLFWRYTFSCLKICIDPFIAKFFMKKIGKFHAYTFLSMFIEFFWLTSKKRFMALAALGSCHVTSSRQGLIKLWRFS